MSQKSCAFCTIEDIKKREIAGNDLAWAFLTNIPITEGHALISPRRCVAKLSELTVEEKVAVFDFAEKVMGSLKKVYGAEGFNCAWNQEKLAGQSVPHFHLHIVPRKEGDTGLIGLDPRNFLYRTEEREVVDEATLRKVSERVREGL